MAEEIIVSREKPKKEDLREARCAIKFYPQNPCNCGLTSLPYRDKSLLKGQKQRNKQCNKHSDVNAIYQEPVPREDSSIIVNGKCKSQILQGHA
jgi:hypothetical protein